MNIAEFDKPKAYWINSVLIFLYFAIIFTVEKNFSFTATAILVAALIGLPIHFKKYKSVPHTLPLVLLMTGTLATINALTRDKGIEESQWLTLFFLALIPIYYYLSVSGFSKSFLVWGLYVAAIVGGVLGTYLATNGFSSIANIRRAYGTALNPVMFGNMGTLLIIFISARIIFLFSNKNWKELIVATIATFSAAFIVLSSGSRTPLIGLSVLLIFFYIYFQLFKSAKFTIAIVILAMIAIGYYKGFQEHTINKRLSAAIAQLTQLGQDRGIDRSTTIRLDLWKISWEMAKHNPIIGSGHANNLENAASAKIRLGMKSEYLKNYTHYHSDFFNIIALFGAAGLSLYILTLATAIRTYIKNRALFSFDLHTLFLGHAIGFISFGFTTVNVGYLNGSAVLFLPIVFFIALVNYEHQIKENRGTNQNVALKN